MQPEGRSLAAAGPLRSSPRPVLRRSSASRVRRRPTSTARRNFIRVSLGDGTGSAHRAAREPPAVTAAARGRTPGQQRGVQRGRAPAHARREPGPPTLRPPPIPALQALLRQPRHPRPAPQAPPGTWSARYPAPVRDDAHTRQDVGTQAGRREREFLRLFGAPRVVGAARFSCRYIFPDS
ncbi:hypothetical protein VULLAG_LOCUS23353 [Vulpes lagopus]